MEEEVVEFNIAHNRKYSIDHLWYQEKDDEKIMVGISEFMGVEIGEVLRVILPQAETVVDEGQDMFSLWTADEKIAFTAPFSGTITEVNGEVEINPDLANDTRYALPIAMAYLEYAGLDNTTANNSSAKDLNNRINAGAGAAIAEERWENVVSNLSGDAATRMENRNEYAAQRTVGTTIDGIIGPNSRTAMREWLSERNITIPQNATDMDLVVLVNENS